MNNNEYIADINRPEIIDLIWQKAIVVEGYDETLYRQDFQGHGSLVMHIMIEIVFWVGR